VLGGIETLCFEAASLGAPCEPACVDRTVRGRSQEKRPAARNVETAGSGSERAGQADLAGRVIFDLVGAA